MNKDLRERAFLPVLLPLLLIAGFFVFSFGLSRVLLAVPATTATFIALVVAGYLLAVAGMVAARPHIPARALAVGLVVGLVGVGAAGAVGAAAGMREIHHEEEAGGGEEEQGLAAEAPEGALVFVAVDVDFEQAPETAEAGELTFFLANEGATLHDVTIEEEGDEVVVEAEGGQTDEGSMELTAGSYTYYCSVPGHREAGMEGTLEVQ